MRSLARAVALAGIVASTAVPLAGAQTPTAEADLAAVKTYMVGRAEQMKAGTANVLAFAQSYYDLAAAADFDYQALWSAQGADLEPQLVAARQAWVDEASANYELNEGLVAGVPSLAYYDVWMDAGPSGEDDPANALDIQLTLPDGRVLDKPGNLFHYLTEPALWGTRDDFVGLRVDMDADGEVELGEALPEANALLGTTQALDDAAAQLQGAIAEWEPNLSDAFTALAVMIPTMDGYFQEWKGSAFVLGGATTDERFVGVSRLADISGILNGLDVTYTQLSPLVAASDPTMATQIGRELGALIAFVEDLYAREQAGSRFTPDQADQFGVELQSRATQLSGQIAQAAALIGVEIQDA